MDAKRRFIQAILDDKLVLQKKTDEEIVEGLKRCNIPPLTNPSKPDDYDSYEYCVRMRIDRVKQSAVIELDKQITEKSTEIERLEAETASSLWLSDLNDFEESWKQLSDIRVTDSISIAKSETPKGKAPRKRKPAIAK